MDLLGLSLGDLPVLTIKTPEVTPGGGYGEYPRSRVEMIEGLLLDGVDINGTGVAVGQGVKLSADNDLLFLINVMSNCFYFLEFEGHNEPFF